MSERSAPDGTATMQGAGPYGDGRSAAAALAALASRAAHTPEEPALFHPEGLDVRWRSWRVLADQVAGGAAALRAALDAEASTEAGAESIAERSPPAVALSWRSHPDAVAAWLAVHAAGGRPMPVSAPAGARAAGGSAWLLQPGEAPPVFEPGAAVRVVSLPEAAAPWARRRGAPEPLPLPAEGGPSAVRPEPDSLAGRIESAAAGSDAAGRAQRPGAREIVLARLDLGDEPRRPGDEALLAWALTTGAALLLEPDARAVAGLAAWARPTVVAAGAHPLAELARWLRARDERPSLLSRWLGRRTGARRPFGRLRLLVVLGTGRLPVDDVPFWADRGVAVLRALAPNTGPGRRER